MWVLWKVYGVLDTIQNRTRLPSALVQHLSGRLGMGIGGTWAVGGSGAPGIGKCCFHQRYSKSWIPLKTELGRGRVIKRELDHCVWGTSVYLSGVTSVVRWVCGDKSRYLRQYLVTRNYVCVYISCDNDMLGIIILRGNHVYDNTVLHCYIKM